MRTLKKLVLVSVLAMMATGCAARQDDIRRRREAAMQIPQPPPDSQVVVGSSPPEKVVRETINDQIDRLSVQPENEEVFERLVRERALQLLREQKAKVEEREKLEASSPIERKARQDVRKQQDKRSKLERERAEVQAEAERFANLSGCDSSTVGIHSYAVRHDNYAAQVTPRIINSTGVPVDIETSYKGIGLAVKDLCPGGGVTLGFILKAPETYYYQNISFVLVARGVALNGKPFSLKFSVNLYNNSRHNYRGNLQKESPVWEIR